MTDLTKTYTTSPPFTSTQSLQPIGSFARFGASAKHSGYSAKVEAGTDGASIQFGFDPTPSIKGNGVSLVDKSIRLQGPRGIFVETGGKEFKLGFSIEAKGGSVDFYLNSGFKNSPIGVPGATQVAAEAPKRIIFQLLKRKNGGGGGSHKHFRQDLLMSIFIIDFIYLIFFLAPSASTNTLPHTRQIGGRIEGRKC